MLSAFGVFWIGEGIGVPWPGEDMAIIAFAALFLLVALVAVALATSPWHGGTAMSALMSLLRQLAGLFVDEPLIAVASPADFTKVGNNGPRKIITDKHRRTKSLD
jgi:uncharacterized membrane protein